MSMRKDCKVIIVLRTCVFFAMLFFAAGKSAAYGSEGVVIMRMSYQAGSRADALIQTQYENNISVDIGKRLTPYHRVFIDSTLSTNRDTGITKADAEKALSNYPANFVLYGSIANESNYLQGRFELFDKRNNKVEYFFASDGINEYNRLIQTVSDNILAWFQTKTEVDDLLSEITELREKVAQMENEESDKEPQKNKKEKAEIKKEPPLKEITLRIPVRVGYWTYTQYDWVNQIQGTVEVNTGIEFIPELQFSTINGMRNELSLNLFAGYRYGLNSGNDPQQVHSIIINPGITYHFNFYTNNWALLGLGVLFEYGMWHVEEPDYGVVSDYKQSLSGMSVLLGYSYRISNRLTVDLGVNMYMYFTRGASPVLRPYFGTSIILLGGKHSAVR